MEIVITKINEQSENLQVDLKKPIHFKVTIPDDDNSIAIKVQTAYVRELQGIDPLPLFTDVEIYNNAVLDPAPEFHPKHNEYKLQYSYLVACDCKGKTAPEKFEARIEYSNPE